MAPLSKPRGKCASQKRPEPNNATTHFSNSAIESQIGIDHFGNVQVTKPRSKRVRQQRPDENILIDSVNDSIESQTGQSDTSENVEVGSDGTNQNNFVDNKKRKARGPTCMPQVWGIKEQLNVSFNDFGQPNDQKSTSTLAHFLGTIARNGLFCPLNYKDWRLMPFSYKEDMLKEVKLRFNLKPGSETFILQSINHKWRNWKCQLKSLNFDPSVPIEEQLLEVPERVNPDQYKQILDYWFTEEAQQLSEKKKEARAKLEILHRMGKRSYAVVSEIMKEHMGRYPTRAELFEKCCNPSDGSPMSEAVREAIEKMKELADQNDGNSSDCNAVHDHDDDFAKIMGKDKDGRLRMYGMGVKPTDIYGGRPSRDALYRKSMEEKEEIRALKEKVEELTALVHTRSQPDRASVLPSNHQSSSRISRPTRIRVGAYVRLKSLGNLNETVAIGILRTIGGVIQNGRDLGPMICEVVVQSILKAEEMLIYPSDLMQSIGDSIGAPIAWPLSLIVLEDDEN